MAMAPRLREQLEQRIRQLRKARGWTQQQLGERADLDYKYLGAVERGERNVTIDNVEKLAAGFGVEVQQLFLFSQAGELPDKHLTEAKLRDLLKHADTGRKQLMLRVLRELDRWEGE